MIFPELVGDPPVLPPRPDPYRCDFTDLRSLFVDGAPVGQREKRSRRLDALEAHAHVVEAAFEGFVVRGWIDGGFVTHKDWGHPKDIDIVYFVPPSEYERAHHGRIASLWTLSDVRATIGASASKGEGPGGPILKVDVLAPLAGLVDAYVAPDTPVARQSWKRRWSSVKGPDGQVIKGMEKGFAEVILGG